MNASWWSLAGAVVRSTLANVFVTRSSVHAAVSSATPVEAYLSPYFVAAVGLFGLNLLLYARALQTIPLSIAYPVLIGASMVGITIAAILLFHEAVDIRHGVGATLVFAGLVLLTLKQAGA